MNFLNKIISRLEADPSKREVRYNDEGFEVFQKGDVIMQVRWDSVIEVAVFKRDLFSVDEICFGFRCEGAETFWWVGEDDLGYAEFEKQLVNRFPGMRTDWFREVALPAFKENWTTLWQKSPGSS